jgi:hypothetical protein
MCMMTSNVFGIVAAENLEHTKVVLEDTIAEGAAQCRVTVYLTNSTAAASATGRDYFKS